MGKNLQFHANSWQGNGATGGRTLALRIGKGAGVAGAALFAWQAANSINTMIRDPNDIAETFKAESREQRRTRGLVVLLFVVGSFIAATLTALLR
jgi:hypothetical protein